MSCFKTGMIQKYIDGEASTKEAALIEEHIYGCEKCAAAVVEQKRFSTGIKRAVSLLAMDKPEIPTFIAPAGRQKKSLKTIKKAVFYLSAACILLFVLLLFPRKEIKNEHQISIIHTIGPVVDANKPITKQEIFIYVIDENGNMTEYHFN